MSLEAVEGRTGSICVAEDGGLVTHRVIDNALAAVEGLQQYRVDQVARERIRCAVIAEGAPGDQVARRAREVLSGLFGAGVSVEAEEVPELVPEASGKFLMVRRCFPLEEGGRG